ncbi:glycoside hydrolase family 2 protein [Bacteroides sp.]|uniref:glycoside hydrolase family 2 protein n=1 Tax=Bacteroides sp. TaxID=29523 RepID=UPI00262E8F4F|nr:sugar-binding domain-containing protein [Bacteroides sp.]
MKRLFSTILLTMLFLNMMSQEQIPLPEHPRPDFERAEWINLNGNWRFTFNEQLANNALQQNNISGFDLNIQVPFGWGSKLSGVEDKGDKGWYAREIQVPQTWEGKRIYLVIGASEWDTHAWIDGKQVGGHQGGYTPFEFEITNHIQFGKSQQIVISADDTYTNERLEGKQGYGNVRGIWQTVYLEARGNNYIDYIHFSPDIDQSVVKVELGLNTEIQKNTQIQIRFKNSEQAAFTYSPRNKKSKIHQFEIKLENQQLWDLDNPYLYEIEATLTNGKQVIDTVNTYFGQRKISVTRLPGFNFPYVALNNQPIYLQLTLDQSYHPEGYYTFPSDKFMRDEILLSKSLGLNGNRTHVKVEIPRKLYWADKLGLLIMADVPNFWGLPTDKAKTDWEYCMRNQIKRDYNHPSIFSWVNFNETWGLFTPQEVERVYLAETQDWVRKMYRETKKLDPTRLVEDNSPCNHDHVETDLNTWHAYLPGYEWKKMLDYVTEQTYPGSTWNYKDGNKQTDIPMFNSECGNVWGYEGSTNDVDYTWDYHIMMNEFRSHPKVSGWLYTEHHDVINEWNGYVRYDRSPKIDGLDSFVPGMTIADFHTAYYIAPQGELCQEVHASSSIEVPLFASFMTDCDPGTLTLETHLIGWDILGHPIERTNAGDYPVTFKPFKNELIAPVQFQAPAESGLYVLQYELKNNTGQILGRNFSLFIIKDGKQPASTKKMTLTSFAPNSFQNNSWSLKQWNVLNGLKVNGAGDGFFEYAIAWPEGVKKEELESVSLVFEASAKELFGKDIEGSDMTDVDIDYMRGGGSFDPCKGQNAYAMTDLKTHPSRVNISVNNLSCGSTYLPDDPADHRGVLSWASQPRNKTLSEAGSYGYLVETMIPKEILVEGKPIIIRMEVPKGINGGLAIYGKDFGRYPLDPTLVFTKK